MSDLEDLEEISAQLRPDKVQDGRVRCGREFIRRIAAASSKITIRKLAKSARQRKVPITLAGHKP